MAAPDLPDSPGYTRLVKYLRDDGGGNGDEPDDDDGGNGDGEDEPEVCDACGYEVDDLEFYPADAFRRSAWLCSLCRNTACGVAYQAKIDDMHVILSTIVGCTHEILARIPDFDEEDDEAPE